ncbi:MAG: hypothetical protein EPN75_11200 [Beijerinckiaceae bacterium]|nr:MAG: hypothetical protein EPN75_11200 [Beijerinckiaceae bacterium]
MRRRKSAGNSLSGSGLSNLLFVLFLGVAALACGAEPGSAHSVTLPLPPPRPPDLRAMLDVPPLPPPRPQIPQSQQMPPSLALPLIGKPHSAGDTETVRAQVLASGKIVADSLPAIVGSAQANMTTIGVGVCGIDAPIRLKAIVLASGDKVVLAPPIVLRASLADALADWVRDDLEPAVADKGDRLAKIVGVGAYQCRRRDRLLRAKVSEHATGDAIDLEGFVTAKGRHFAIALPHGDADADRRSFLALMKKTACQRFTTVLGPGADSYHAGHLHLDLETRRHSGHLCEWNLPPDSADRAASKAP